MQRRSGDFTDSVGLVGLWYLQSGGERWGGKDTGLYRLNDHSL